MFLTLSSVKTSQGKTSLCDKDIAIFFLFFFSMSYQCGVLPRVLPIPTDQDSHMVEVCGVP